MASVLGFGLLLAGSAATAEEKPPMSAAPTWKTAPPPLDRPEPGTLLQGNSLVGAPEMPRALPASWELKPVTMQVPPDQPPVKAPTEETTDIKIQLEPPGPDRIFRRDSERTLQERMRQEGLTKIPPERIKFPDEPILSKLPYSPRSFPPARAQVEPGYVCYGRLYFEDLNTERYGWDLGFIQPIVSAGSFFVDVLELPYHMGTAPCRKYECSSGYCLPGDSVPFLLYPPDLSLSGAVLEIGTLFGVAAIFPG